MKNIKFWKRNIFALLIAFVLFLSISDKLKEEKGIEVIVNVNKQIKPLNYQIFYMDQENEGFSEEKSLRKVVEKTPINGKISFLLNIKRLKNLRVDLGEDFEEIYIKDITIKGDKEIILLPKDLVNSFMLGIESKKIESGLLHLTSKSTDPIIALNNEKIKVSSQKEINKLLATVVFILLYFLIVKFLEYLKNKKLNFEWYSKFSLENKILHSILMLLPVSILYGGEFFKNLLIPGMFLFFIVTVMKNGLKKSFYEKYMILFIISILISIIFSNYGRTEGLDKIYNDLSWLLLPTIFGQFKLRDKEFKLLLLSTYFGMSILFFRYLEEIQISVKEILKVDIGIMEIFTYNGWKLVLEMSEEMWRLGVAKPFKYIAHNGAILSVVIIILTSYIFYEKNIKWRISALFFLIPSLCFLMLTQSRSSYLGLIIFFMYLSYKKISSLSSKIKIGLIGGLILILSFFKNTPFGRRAEAIGAIDTSNLGRIEVYKESFRIFKENILTGVGYENFKLAQVTDGYKIHSMYKHSHNLGLKFLSETGIIGFIGYFLMIFSLIKNFFKRRNEFQGFLGLVIVSFVFIFENFEILIFSYKLYAFIFIYIGYSMNIFYEKIESQ